MNHPKFEIFASPGFAAWLRSSNISLALSTYQIGKLFLLGTKTDGRLSVFERTFNRCMGLWSDSQTIWLAAAYQLWRLDNVLASGAVSEDGYDRLFVPTLAQTTGDIDAHDMAVDKNRQPVFVSTLFSCLARASEELSFEPIWQPPFVSQLAAEDRCHLNGLACDETEPRFVTACSQTNTRNGWRKTRDHGGVVIDVKRNETITQGLSMPHSPRIRGDELWLLDSGHGYLGRVDPRDGSFERIEFCPGYARGLAFHENYALVGLSRPRQKTFAGLPLDDELSKRQTQPLCGLQVVDLHTGRTVEWLKFEGIVEELYDVLVLPGVQRPKALGLKTDEIQRNVWFKDDGRVVRWTAGEA